MRFIPWCLRERARDWWEEVSYALGGPVIEAMTWPNFVTIFRAEIASAVEVHQLVKEFQDLLHMTETATKITANFRERGLLVPLYAINEEMKKNRYHDILRADIQDFVSFSTCRTLEDMIARAREREINLEHLRKMKVE